MATGLSLNLEPGRIMQRVLFIYLFIYLFICLEFILFFNSLFGWKRTSEDFCGKIASLKIDAASICLLYADFILT